MCYASLRKRAGGAMLEVKLVEEEGVEKLLERKGTVQDRCRVDGIVVSSQEPEQRECISGVGVRMRWPYEVQPAREPTPPKAGDLRRLKRLPRRVGAW